MLSDLLKWGGKRLEPAQAGALRGVAAPAGDEPVVGSKALPEVPRRRSPRSRRPVLLDFGPVIGTNVEFFGERLGCKLFIEDSVADLDRHTQRGTLDALPGALETRFRHADASVDGILCWDIFDFLDKTSAQALARQVIRMLRPGGAVMGLFCTSAKTDHAPFTKYEIVDDGNFRHRTHPGVGGVEARAAEPRHHPDVRRARSSPTRSSSRATSAKCCCAVAPDRAAHDAARCILSGHAPCHRAPQRLRHRAITMPGR